MVQNTYPSGEQEQINIQTANGGQEGSSFAFYDPQTNRAYVIPNSLLHNPLLVEQIQILLNNT